MSISIGNKSGIFKCMSKTQQHIHKLNFFPNGKIAAQNVQMAVACAEIAQNKGHAVHHAALKRAKEKKQQAQRTHESRPFSTNTAVPLPLGVHAILVAASGEPCQQTARVALF